MDDLQTLRDLVLAPYVLKATSLIRVQRRVGGNQFRHCFSTLGILLDYKYYNESVLLKASLLHDLFEDLPETRIDEIRYYDEESNEVADLVLEVTKPKGEPKQVYLQRLLERGSRRAMLLKCADRISNLTDLHTDTDPTEKFSDTLDLTEQFVIPMAQKVNADMVKELTDLVRKRRDILLMTQKDSEKPRQMKIFNYVIQISRNRSS